MRASRHSKGQAARDKGQTISSCKPLLPTPDIHISGAEGICSESNIQQIIQEYVDRALTHPRGKPDKIVITLEQLMQPPKAIAALPLITVKCGSTARAETIIRRLLTESGISDKAITSALSILRNIEAMRGASLVLAASGRRVEPDMQRGVRASRLGIAKSAEKALSAKLNKLGLDTQTVREALILASKVTSCNDVVAELCISDNPGYTTGYVASAYMGYVRIPHIKKKQDPVGGRIFFLREGADLTAVIEYLEKTPVVIDRTAPCLEEISLEEILDSSHK